MRRRREQCGDIAILLLLVALSGAGCASAPPPVSAAPAAGRPVVVIVPGMTGSRLCSASTGEVLWGSVRRMVVPWDGGYRIARPLDGSDDDVTPCGPILEMRIGSWRKDIYGGLISFLEREGFAVRFFDHDWRRDSVENAAKLTALLETFPQPVQLICQSNGNYICRWAIKNGGAGPRVEKMILIGTANGGALRILREMNRGRQYIRLFGRRFRPEIFFTMPAIFQDLPVYKRQFFEPVDAGLFDPVSWETYGWSIFAPEVRARIEGRRVFGTEEERRAHLIASLGRARSMHDTLHRESGVKIPPIYSIQSVDFPTIDGATIRDGETLFSKTAPGDVHASKESQEWLSREELDAMAEPPIVVSGRHFEMITTDETRAILLRILRTPRRP